MQMQALNPDNSVRVFDSFMSEEQKDKGSWLAGKFLGSQDNIHGKNVGFLE